MFTIICDDEIKLKFINEIILDADYSHYFKRFYYFDEIESTQEFAIKFLDDKTEINLDPSVIIANKQTSGRGRRGTYWSSQEGGLWFSIIFRSILHSDNIFIYIILCIYSIFQTIQKFTGLKPVIKWPNDVFINGKKVAGLLLDTQSESTIIKYIVVGIGINSNNEKYITEAEISEDNKNTQNYTITTLSYELNRYVSNKDLFNSILKNIGNILPNVQCQKVQNDLLDFYKEKIYESMDNIRYKFEKNGQSFNGRIINVKKDGSLLVKNLDRPSEELININSAFEVK